MFASGHFKGEGPFKTCIWWSGEPKAGSRDLANQGIPKTLSLSLGFPTRVGPLPPEVPFCPAILQFNGGEH